ncbi:MAG TPA: Gfo/Idh/MocA family oxidoreductase [Candidatus Brocadiia bacterium]|nr:Gfo/Idh/MocA family oxidoreductase [Candidatus Brocadiia bacterium]
MKKFKDPSEIKVGVVGYGGSFNMGRHHFGEMKRVGMVPTAVADIDEARLKVAEQEFPGIETYNSLEKMLRKSDINLVTVITPHNIHAKLAVQSINAGRHVVSEKPFAITTKECDAMINAAKKKGVVISTYHNRHWDGCALGAVKKILKDGCIGEVFRIQVNMGGYGCPGEWWRSSKTISGGILYDWGVHLLEYSLQIMAGEEIAEVSGYAKKGYWADKCKWKADTNEDEAFGVVRFKSGKWLTLRMSSLESNPTSNWLEITGTTGTYLMDHGSYTIMTRKDGENVRISGRNPESESWRFYQNIADHLTKGEPLVITGEWARRPIHILDLACQSAKKGAAIKAKYK